MGEVVYGPTHVRSLLGILKLCEIITCLIAIILVAVLGWTNDLVNAFYAGTIIGLILSVLLLVLCSTSAGHSMNGIMKFQFVCHIVLFIYLLIVSSIMIARYYSRSSRVGGIFGLIASLFYLMDAGVSYRSYDIRMM